ncbi:MAG: hypothetical protein JSS10_02855 [Verrucomicrobia bacterium]|nr:hypothetical protein [Verrucomicrobiota bacterium]
MATRPLNGSFITTPQDPYYVFPSLLVPPDTTPLSPLPLPAVQAVGLRTLQPRAAFTPLDNSLGLSPTSTGSSRKAVKLEERARENGVVAQALAGIASSQGANNTLLPPRVSLATAPSSSRDIPYTGSFVLATPKPIFVPEGSQPAQPAPAAAPPQPARRKRRELDWKDGTPAAYRQAPNTAGGEKKVRPEPLPAVHSFPVLSARPILPKREVKAETAVKSEEAEQQLPELRTVRTPARRASRLKKEPKAGFDFQETITPDNFRATIAARRTSGSSTFYESSNDSIDSSESLYKAADYIEQKKYQAAVGALYQALFFLHGKEGFIFLMMLELNTVIRANTDRRITSSGPENDLDVLILRAIYKIKHGKLESAKIDLQQVLTQRPHEQLAQILLDHANIIIHRPADLNWTPAGKTPKQELAGTSPS